MSEAENYTAQQAADPQTPGQVLADIAALRPDLRPAVASNPSAYPSLLEWLGGLGEPSVDAALRARAAAAPVGPADGQPTVVLPTAPGTAPYRAAPSAGYGAPSAGYGAPTAGYGAAPGAPYGAGAQGYVGAPGQAYGYQPVGTPPRKSNKVLWIVLGVVGFFVILGVVGFIVIRGLVANAFPDGDLGSDPALDALVTQCENEDWAACDELYDESPVGSEYERFGDTCGNRTDGGTYCVEEFGDASEPSTYGDDADLDALWDACADGDGQACDDLYNESPVGSDYESFGDTCGGTTDGTAGCADGVSGSSYGDDPELDVLWDACAAGDGVACDDLFRQAPSGSEYEDFGNTCAGTTDGSAWCAPDAESSDADTYGDDPELDALWDACAAGDGQACDDLYSTAPVGSQYEEFGDTCAGTTDGTEWCAP